jgi:hypothetical protein
MADKHTLLDALAPVLAACAGADLSDVGATRRALTERFPPDGETWRQIKALFAEGRAAGWLCDRENAGVRFSRVLKATSPTAYSIDAVHMSAPGPGHTHSNGEIDLCFAVSGDPRFDGQPEGFVVYAPGSWHVPTVAGGVMDILYLLPGGAITFEDKPRG